MIAAERATAVRLTFTHQGARGKTTHLVSGVDRFKSEADLGKLGLYVACTRARDNLLITSVEPASEFLDDLRM